MGAWQANRRMWVAVLLLLALNLVALTGYRLIWASRAEAREARVDRASGTFAQLEARRRALEEYVERARTSEHQVATFLADRLGRQQERLTEIIAEIKALARTAGLEPSQISYRAEPLGERGLVRRSLNFTVSGTYLDLRKLINLLELSDSFILLEQVALSETDEAGATLRINLQLTAFFADPAGSPSPARGRRG